MRKLMRFGAALLAALAVGSTAAQPLTENFDSVAALPGAGWVFTNNSAPVGLTSWFQGNTGVFAAQAGANDAYMGANFNAAGNVAGPVGGNVSLWALTPQLTDLQNGQVLTFYTRTETGAIAADRLEVRLSLNGASTNVGATDASVGDFTTLLATVNSALTVGGYPSTWTLVTVTLSGLPAGANAGRIGFRYTYPDNFVNGDYIGIDSLALTGAVADLTVTKSHVGNFTQGQVGATYTLNVGNAGTQPTTGLVSLVDTLPAGLTATALSGTGWTCTLGTLTCTRSDVLAGGGAYPPVTLTVTVSGSAPASVTNTATVSGGGQINTANDTASDPTTVDVPALLPDLAIVKTHSGNFTQGQVGATYSMTITNVGAGATVGTVTVVDTLPAGLTATSLTGTGWTCVLGTLTCTRSDALAAAGSYPAISLVVTVAGNAAASVTNTAVVSGGGESNAANSTANDPTTVIAATPDLTIAKSHSGSFTQGQVGATYTITVGNAGNAATTGTVTVVDTLPAGLTATSLTGSGWTCVLGTLTCTRSDALAPAGNYPAITLVVTVAGNAAASVTNTAVVSGGGESNAANSTANDVTTILAGAPDLTVAKTHAGNFTQGQIGATYAIVVSNVGAVPTSGTVTVVDTLPAGLTATAMSGTGWSCVVVTSTCTRSDALAAGGSYPSITLTVNVAANASASISNTVAVSGGGDGNAANNVATDPTTVVAAATADIAIAKTHAGSFTQGQIGATYAIVVSNAGPGPTVGAVTVTDTLPAGLTATALSGTGWTCVLGTLTCSRSDVLAAAGSYPPITVTVNVAANAAASVVNVGTVSGGGDSTPGNNSASDTTTIVPAAAPDLRLVKSHAAPFAQGQSGAQYALVASNIGNAATSGPVTVVDALPAGLTATSMSGAGWTCVVGTLTCTRADALAAGASYPPITLTVDVAANAAANVVNTATVSGGGDVSPANNGASDPTAITAGIVDLAIVVTTNGNFVQGQSGASYAIAVSNIGTLPTTGPVTVVDTLPAGLTATSFSGPGWSCVLATLTCTRSDALAPGASYPSLTLTVGVGANAPATVINGASVAGGGDANGSNNAAAKSTTILPAAVLSDVANIPTLSEWGLLLLALLLGGFGVHAVRRQER